MSKASRNRRQDITNSMAGFPAQGVVNKSWQPKPQGIDWLTLFGFQLGDEIVIFPIGITGQSLGGELVDIALTPENGPIMVVIRNAAGRPNVSIPWSSIMMITKAEGPKIEAPPQPDEFSLQDIAEFAQSQGMEVPAEVWEAINNPDAGGDDTTDPEF